MISYKKKINVNSSQSQHTLSYKEILEDLLEQVESKYNSNEKALFKDFVTAYYEQTPIEELRSISPAALYDIAESHWQLTYQRKPEDCNIRVYNNPNHANDLWKEGYSIIMVAMDDMPFIVDSICMLLSQKEIAIHFIMHRGNLKLQRRASDHTVTAISTNGTENHAINEKDYDSEALVYLIIDRQTSAESLHDLKKDCITVLNEVNMVVTDWLPMRDRMFECLSQLENISLSNNPIDINESKDFLRWLLDDHFIFFGCRDYKISKDKNTLQIVRSSSLGVLKDETRSSSAKSISALPPEARELTLSPQLLVFTTTNTKARVHRPVYTEYIGVKRFDKTGQLLGECRFIGLYTSRVYQCDAHTIPLVRRKLEWALTQSQFPRNSHSGKALLDSLVNLPRGELLQASAETLLALGLGMLSVQAKPAIRLFVRQDSYQRFISCLVYVPRHQLTTSLQKKIETILMDSFAGLEFSFEMVFSESQLARMHFLIRTKPKKIPAYEVKHIEAHLAAAARSWQEDLQKLLSHHYGPIKSITLFQKYQNAFPSGYRETWSAEEALADILYIEELSNENLLTSNLYQLHKTDNIQLRFQLFQLGKPITLSKVLSVLEQMGLQVIDEWPTQVKPQGNEYIWIHNFGLRPLKEFTLPFKVIKPLFQEAFLQIWQEKAENDQFNQLVLIAGLSWREIVILRAYTKYMHQIGTPFSQSYVEKAVIQNPLLVKQMIDLFKQRFEPKRSRPTQEDLEQSAQQFENALDSVLSLDEDRILHQLWVLINATLRTNYFQQIIPSKKTSFKPWLSFKLDASKIPELPHPKPLYEIFVYSPHMEGIHLRASKVSRGGLRWSDRREDFRTEVLGLTKAQQVKNAVIVPGGAKGGFVCKNINPQWDREKTHHHVITCYQTFIKGLLDITDNIKKGRSSPPPRTVRYDESDPYLVVAADKGTASFSDVANQIADDYQFWLGDAFASGGSQGYDHKKMGITAKGVWESIKWHFHTLGINPYQDDFTVAGIGDMSGDVFGNGMLLSSHIKLIAAFNHLHIFIDPYPDPIKSFTERKRLFELPRSNWTDYDPSKISKGGGIFSRYQKSISVTPEMQKVLNLSISTITPHELIQAILKAPVDLLWNGGVGTYVKASHESHNEVGDKTHDALRVDARDLNCRVVGEGGNLGFTQSARIEYALKGGLIYTDFIDNSAGVDCSDQEVNCKILLNAAVGAKAISLEKRNQILIEMTNDITTLVLRDNYHQTRAISAASLNTIKDIELYRAYLNHLENEELLNRSLECLPDNQILTERKVLNQGLTNPEMAILLAYTKIQIKNSLIQQLPAISKAPYLLEILKAAFPKTLQQHYVNYMPLHSLRREIIATRLSNDLVNQMGVIFIYHLTLETGSEIATIVHAWLVVCSLFELDVLLHTITGLANQLALEIYARIIRMISQLARRAIRWIIEQEVIHLHHYAIDAIVVKFKPAILELKKNLVNWLSDDHSQQYYQMATYLSKTGIPENIASNIARLEYEYGLLPIIQLASSCQYTLENTARAWLLVGNYFEFDWLRTQICKQVSETHWDTLTRVALLDDLDAQQTRLTHSLLYFIAKEDKQSFSSLPESLNSWKTVHDDFYKRWKRLLADLRSTAELKLMVLSIALRTLASLTRQITS